LTPVNPSFGENGEFIQIGQSIPARQRPPKKNNNNNRNRNQGRQSTNQGHKGENNHSQNSGSTHKNHEHQNPPVSSDESSDTSEHNDTQNNHGQKRNVSNQNRDSQNKNQSQHKNQGNNKNQGHQGQKKNPRGKYQLKSQSERPSTEKVSAQTQDELLQSPPDTYYEVTVRNTTTNVVFTLFRRQDELDKPILLLQEITF